EMLVPMQARNEIESKIILKAWEDDTYRQSLIVNPRAVLSEEIGQPIPDGGSFKVVEEKPNSFYLVLPQKPRLVEASIHESEELTQAELESVAGGAVMVIGTKKWNVVFADSTNSKFYAVFSGI
ncbi:MAG: NHLP leader peptide family RiPP precursor, partial [Cyanophyceae cyanobacterium]